MIRKIAAIFFMLAVQSVWSGAQAEPSLRSFGPDSFAEIKAEHAGKPFVLMMWSLDCPFCAESLKTLMRAGRKHEFAVVTIATDSAEDPESRALIKGRLDAANASEHAWAFGAAPGERLRYVIDPKWRGELPRTYWFNGKEQGIAHSGAVTEEALKNLVPKLLR